MITSVENIDIQDIDLRVYECRTGRFYRSTYRYSSRKDQHPMQLESAFVAGRIHREVGPFNYSCLQKDTG